MSTSLVPQTATEFKEAVHSLAARRGPMTEYALMSQSELQLLMNRWFQEAEDLKFIRMVYLLVKLGGTVNTDGILYQIREIGLVIDLAYVGKTNSHIVTVNGNIVLDTSDAGAIRFIPGERWIPSVVHAFNTLTAEPAFRAAQTEELQVIETIRALSANV